MRGKKGVFTEKYNVFLDHVINNHGGLYGRVTYEMKLYPFTLKECELFLDSRNICMSRYDMTQTYMMVGGIPYYLKYFEKELSLLQNIDNIVISIYVFGKDGLTRFCCTNEGNITDVFCLEFLHFLSN